MISVFSTLLSFPKNTEKNFQLQCFICFRFSKKFQRRFLFFSHTRISGCMCLLLNLNDSPALQFKFGECGKRDGQLLYPNRVSVVKHTGDIVVTERSPTHQIQVYNKYGQFLRKFGANILQHPRGVCVDNKGRIIVVECKVMRVLIFDLMGNVLQKFNCSKYLEFPNGVCCSSGLDREEIYISDNRAHCIKVA